METTAEAAREVLGRLAALVCDDEQVGVDELRMRLAGAVDAALLDPLAGPERVAAQARELAGEGFANLVVQPCNVGRVAWELAQAGSATGACGVLAYPQGQDTPEALCFEVALACAAGAAELDLVLNAGAFLEGAQEGFLAPVEAALGTIDADEGDDGELEGFEGFEDEDACEGDACGCGHHHAHEHEGDACGCGCEDGCSCEDDEDEDDACDGHPLLKAVLEVGCLTPEQVCAAADAVSALGVDFLVAGTGCGPRAATEADVRLMCATVEPGVQVAAWADDACTVAEVLPLLEAGAVRVVSAHARELLADFDRLAGLACAAGADAVAGE